MSGRLLALVLAASVLVGVPGSVVALTLRPCPHEPLGHREHDLVTATYRIPYARQRGFQQQLAAWSRGAGYHVSGRAGFHRYDLARAGADGWLIEVWPAGDDMTSISVQFVDHSPVVVLTVSKWCWSDPGDWRRHWRRVRDQMTAWGYHRQGRASRGGGLRALSPSSIPR